MVQSNIATFISMDSNAKTESKILEWICTIVLVSIIDFIGLMCSRLKA